MRRQFSNRGEALPEVTAALCLASRKAKVRTSFMSQADRWTGSSGRLPPTKGAITPFKTKQRSSNKENTLFL